MSDPKDQELAERALKLAQEIQALRAERQAHREGGKAQDPDDNAAKKSNQGKEPPAREES